MCPVCVFVLSSCQYGKKLCVGVPGKVLWVRGGTGLGSGLKAMAKKLGSYREARPEPDSEMLRISSKAGN